MAAPVIIETARLILTKESRNFGLRAGFVGLVRSGPPLAGCCRGPPPTWRAGAGRRRLGAMGKKTSTDEKQRNVSHVFADGTTLSLTDQQIQEFQQAFNLFDKDQDGHVTAKELRIVFDTLGQQPSDEELKEMINEVDKDGNGEMEFTEFCVLMSKRMENKEDGETLIKAFEVLDLDGSGSIERDELRKVLKGFSDAGEHLSEDEIELLIKEADVDGDGQISFTEFAKVMMAEPEEGDDKK